jgi:DNA polymerase III subunit delta'
MNTDAVPEADRIDGAPHPRETPILFGHGAAEQQFLAAFNAGRPHHAWLIAGPEGIGKATLAWRIARFLLAAPDQAGGLFGDPEPATSLDIPSDHPVMRRTLALSEPRLFLLRRPWDDKTERLKQDITVDEVRRMKAFFQLSAAEGGPRAAIIDAADDLNPSAANALLKLLEEPPPGVTFLVVAHRPSGLLPTIRSRCRDLRLAPLGPGDLSAAMTQAGFSDTVAPALAVLAAGSVGAAIRLQALDGMATYARVTNLFATLPRLDRPRALALAERAGARGAEAATDLLFTLALTFLSRLARAGATGDPGHEAAPGEAALISRIAPDPAAGLAWADLHDSLAARIRHGRAVNLDPAALFLDMILQTEHTAGRLARG